MLIITGTQRSGTTFTAQFLHRCGLQFGEQIDWDETITGGFDDLGVDRFLREYIGDKTFSYRDIDDMAVHGGEIEPNIFPKGDVFKVAYLLMNPIFIHILHKFRGKGGDRFLILNRNKDDVWRTKQRRWDRFVKDSTLLKQYPDEMRFNWNRSISVIDEYGYDYEVLQFPEFLGDFDAFAETLERLGHDVWQYEDEWNRLVDPDKVHFGKDKLHV
jgi:hypothetical protein